MKVPAAPFSTVFGTKQTREKTKQVGFLHMEGHDCPSLPKGYKSQVTKIPRCLIQLQIKCICKACTRILHMQSFDYISSCMLVIRDYVD